MVQSGILVRYITGLFVDFFKGNSLRKMTAYSTCYEHFFVLKMCLPQAYAQTTRMRFVYGMRNLTFLTAQSIVIGLRTNGMISMCTTYIG